VVVPIARRYDWDSAKQFSAAIVSHLAQTLPDRFVAKSGPKNRVGRVFVDFIRNSMGATTASAFSARARKGLGVSMPIAASQLADLERADQWTVSDALVYLKKRRLDPWKNYAAASQQRIDQAAKRIGHVLKAKR
jgi:bifunctional non-homologous end joining protein LigD